jgi:hypothetical protein
VAAPVIGRLNVAAAPPEAPARVAADRIQRVAVFGTFPIRWTRLENPGDSFEEEGLAVDLL